jgi:hypothetical protein
MELAHAAASLGAPIAHSQDGLRYLQNSFRIKVVMTVAKRFMVM